MFSLENIDFQFEAENEQNSVDLPCKTHTPTDVFREPSRQEIDLNKIRSEMKVTSPITTERITTKAVRRKFPGPAGLLPDKPPQSFKDSSFILEHIENDSDVRKEEPVLCSQASESIFSEPQFKKLSTDFKLENRDSPLNAFTIDWVKKKALGKGLKGRKIPFMAVILQSVDCSSPDPLVTLSDRTGELYGALHREVWKEMGNQLQAGTALALKEVGVLSTGVSRRQVILNMTKNNILSIYSSTGEGEVSTETVQPATIDEILQNVAEWQVRAAEKLSSPKPPQREKSTSLFVQHAAASSPKGIIYQNTTNSKPFRSHFLQQSKTEDLFPGDDIDFASIVDGSEQAMKKPKPDDEEMNASKSHQISPDSQTILSQAETSMLDDVLSGVDLDDF